MVFLPLHPRRQKCRPARLLLHFTQEISLYAREFRAGESTNPAECRADKILKRDERGHGVSGQTEDQFPSLAREDRRLSGFHGDSGKEDLKAKLFEDFFNQIVFPHGHAARQDQDVPPETVQHQTPQFALFVPGDAKVFGFQAHQTQLTRERIGIGVADLAGTRRVFHFNQLVSRSDQSHARPRVDFDPGGAECGQDSDLCRPDAAPGLQHGLPRPRLTAHGSDVCPEAYRLLNDHILAVSGALRQLHNLHGIGPFRYGGPGHDGGSFPRADAQNEAASGPNLAHTLEAHGGVSHILCAQSETIHC